MNQQDSITQSDFTNLLASGAFLRDQETAVALWGPFEVLSGDKRQEISVSCPNFYETEKLTFLKPARIWQGPVSDFARQCLRFVEENPAPASTVSWQEPEKSHFEKAFARIQNMIAEGQIDKAVPVVFARAQGMVTPAMKARWLLELLSAPANLHIHGWWDGEHGLLGATPEVLFETNGRHLKTMALAGTLAKADGNAQDLFRSAKEQHEHRLVVEDIRNELKNFGHVRVGTTRTVELPSLWHLHTEIEADLNEDPDVVQLLRRLHPTAALGVFPRTFGWAWMRELPGQEGRARYGAPMTFRLSPERTVSLVSIRNIQWQSGQMMIGSGCGLVKDSELEAEWNEVSRKRQSVRKLLGMAT